MPVQKRGSVWYYNFTIEGKRYKKAVPEARNKAEALRIENEVRQRVYAGEEEAPEVMSFRQFVTDIFLPWSRENKRSYQSDEWRAKVLIESFGDCRLTEIVPFAVEKFKVKRRNGVTVRQGQRSAASVNREFELLSRICSMAVDHGHLAENPCRRVRKFRLDNRRERYLTRDEEPRLLKAADGYSRKYLKAIIVIALNTGMRRGEILNLVWADVDATRGLLLVSNTKSGRDRYVPINEAVRNVLGGLSRCEGDEEARLFEIDWIEKGWRRICREAGIRNLRFHDLRHTAATRMSEAGVRETTIAAILGHAGLQMTARYTHATDETVRKAIEMLDSKVPFQICSNETFEQTAKGT